MLSGLTTTRFDIAYCVALYFALESCGMLLFGGVPQGPATEQAFGWAAFAAIMIAPIVLWRTRNSRAGPFLQLAFIAIAAIAVMAAILLS